MYTIKLCDGGTEGRYTQKERLLDLYLTIVVDPEKRQEVTYHYGQVRFEREDAQCSLELTVTAEGLIEVMSNGEFSLLEVPSEDVLREVIQ